MTTRTARGPNGRTKDLAIGSAVGLLTAAILVAIAFRGWLPHDEGTLGQTAIRVMSGQVPHIDFQDVYPGLQGYLHAAFFSVFGVSIASLRLAWLAISAITAFASFSVLRRFTSSAVAASASVSATILGFAIYPASLPSWWNLALGMSVIAIVLRSVDRKSSVGLVAAGLLTGVSVLIKSSGGAFIALPILVWLVARQAGRRWVYTVAFASATVLVLVIAPAISLNRVLLLATPSLAAVAVVARSSHVEGRSSPFPSDGVLYGLGVAAPVGVVALGYVVSGHGGDLLEGWILSPSMRYQVVEADMRLSWATLVVCLSVGLVVYLAHSRGLPPRVLGLSVASLVVLIGLWKWNVTARLVIGAFSWLSLGLLVIALKRRFRGGDPRTLVLACALVFLLIQIPIWNAAYAAYTIPLLCVALVVCSGAYKREVAGVIAAVALLFVGQSMAGRLAGTEPSDEAFDYIRLESDRAGIWVREGYHYYDPLIRRISEVVDSSRFYGGPDAPELAFLADVEPATGAFFEILDPQWSNSIPTSLAEGGTPVAINNAPVFSDPISSMELKRIYDSLPNSERFGPFELRWTDGDG